MGTDDRAATDRQRVYEELASTLQTLRGGAHAGRMATALLRHARGATALVALVDGGDRAVFYTANARTLAAVPFDRHGVDADDAGRAWRSLGDPTTWVDAADPDWVHPRYRGVRANGPTGTRTRP
ncbi:MAG: hypothetical protein V5A23_02220 [Halobacteriales archaeon]